MALFSPTTADVERYTRLRAARRELSGKIVKTAPRKAMQEIGAAIGILRRGVLVFETEDVTSVLMDCCLHDWFEGGKNVVRRYMEDHAPKPNTDEALLLGAYLQAQYCILVSHSAVPGAGVRCRDAVTREELFLMDVGFSRTLLDVTMPLATRIIPLGEYWMTGGAALPLSAEAVQDVLSRLTSDQFDACGIRSRTVLKIVQACLASGAAERIRYEDSEAESQDGWEASQRPYVAPRVPGRNERCPCGSGRKYKVCCGRG